MDVSQFAEEVPFVIIAGRKALSIKQVIEFPYLQAFVERFADCFEFCVKRQCYFFTEAETNE